MNGRLYALLLLISVLAGVGGVLTLMPAEGASYPNLFGYQSLCTFAPAASLYCFAIAGASCVIRASFVKRKAMFGRSVLKRAAVAVVAGVLVLAVAATIWFVDVKAEYTDDTSTATTQT